MLRKNISQDMFKMPFIIQNHLLITGYNMFKNLITKVTIIIIVIATHYHWAIKCELNQVNLAFFFNNFIAKNYP